MKKALLAVVFVCGAFTLTAQAEVLLPRTDDARSVQAILFDALAAFGSERPDLVQFTENGELLVASEEEKVVCDAGPIGMLPVQTYTCLFSSAEWDWTKSSVSVPAILYKALVNLYQINEESSYQEYNPVKVTSEGAVVVEDEKIQLLCDAKSLGLLTVESYMCRLLQK